MTGAAGLARRAAYRPAIVVRIIKIEIGPQSVMRSNGGAETRGEVRSRMSMATANAAQHRVIKPPHQRTAVIARRGLARCRMCPVTKADARFSAMTTGMPHHGIAHVQSLAI
ncbi:hypothetical protein IP70_21825 [alpha proteobacterium AAP38]|nr:hypothetical protein IP70_21825 [alpha proteobacterium AAP38]